MRFPISITERGDRIAAMVSIDGNRESFEREWIVIKKVDKDEVESVIDVMDLDLSLKLDRDCRNWPAPCVHMDEVNRRVAEVNAVLAKGRWRRLPCYSGLMDPDRSEPGCDRIWELDIDFENTRLRVVQRGRLLVDAQKPTWIYRHPRPSCNSAAMTGMESVSFDLETGILVVGLHFWSTVEGCSVPRWDFHPIRVPALRSKPSRDHDGRAP
jgi:hypothetical protein